MQEGASRVYHAGVELLRTRRLSRRSLRLAMRRIIGEHVGSLPGAGNEPTARGRVNEIGIREKKGGCRAPPLPLTVDS